MNRTLFLPWRGLLTGFVILWLGRVVSLQAPISDAWPMLASDALLLVRMWVVWCVLALVLTPASERAQRWVHGVLGVVLWTLMFGLDVYFEQAGVPLGADVFAYSWEEITTTVSGADVRPPWILCMSWALACVMWCWSMARRSLTTQRSAVLLGLVLALFASWSLPMRVAQAGAGKEWQTNNKLLYWMGDVWVQYMPNDTATEVVSDFPFERTESTPDTLGPLFSLNGSQPPHIVLVVVEGLGRSFSGPGARLGSFTPFLDQLAERSLYWENFLATQGRTFAVLPSVLSSLPFGPHGEQPKPHQSLPGWLKKNGYELRYFTGTNLAFDHQGDFLAASGVQTFWSERDFAEPARKLSEWGYADGDLMAAVAHGAPASSPTVTVVQTMSMHTPFVVPQAERWRQAVEARLDALGLRGAPRETVLRQKDIYASILYTDDALRGLFARLSQQAQWRNTVVLITGDHRLPEIEMASRIERYHVPLIIASPMLRQPLRIKALSSHFDIAPSLLAMLSQRYAMPMPQRVHWMGTGLDVHPGWRNLHSLPLKQTKTELSDYISGEYYLAHDKLYNLQDGLVTTPEDRPEIAEALKADFAAVRAGLAQVVRTGQLVDEVHRDQRAVYAEAGRTLAPLRPARQIEGVVVSGAQGQFVDGGSLSAQGVFSVQGAKDAPVFVPLLVLSDGQGRQLAEASGPAMRLQVGQAQTVSLTMQVADLPAGTYFMSLVVSHPDTGRPIGRGQYHVPVQR